MLQILYRLTCSNFTWGRGDPPKWVITGRWGGVVDAGAALDWLQQNNPNAQSNLILGFSFGAWIAMQLVMRRPEINHFIAISPPVNTIHKYDFSFLST